MRSGQKPKQVTTNAPPYRTIPRQGVRPGQSDLHIRRQPGRAAWLRQGLFIALIFAGAARCDEVVLGMSAVFSGPSRSLGLELYRGSHAVFENLNRKGGLYGHRVVLKAYDDGYDPNRAIGNTLRLVEQDQAFALFGYVGTPTVTRVLPLLKHYSAAPLYLLFPFTGAEPQRRAPYAEFVFNLRASYRNETAALVTHFLNSGHEQIGVFYQADAYGRGGWEGVRLALQRAGREICAEATYRRGSGFVWKSL